MAGENGGSAFVIMYILLTITIGVPILIAKMIIGNKTQKNVVKAFEELDTSKNKHWKKAGIMLIGGPIILSFYTVILGWVLYYLFIVSFNLPKDAQTSEAVFLTLIKDNFMGSFISFAICVFLTGYIVSRGVKNGLEKFNFILMPLLFIIFIGLLLYAMTLPSFKQALDFLFVFDAAKLNPKENPKALFDALNQVFFSLSIGVGIIITYSASAQKGQNLLSSALWIALSGIVVSLVAGMIIFTFLFEHGQNPNSGVGMLFISLPLSLNNIGYAGNIISFLFFTSVLFAGLTSTISVLEPSVAYLCDRFNASRQKVTFFICVFIFLVGLLAMLSYSNNYGMYFTFFKKPLFDLLDNLTSAIIMPAGGLISIIFLAYAVKKHIIFDFSKSFMTKNCFNVWYIIVKYIAPVIVTIVLYGMIINIIDDKSPYAPDAILKSIIGG